MIDGGSISSVYIETCTVSSQFYTVEEVYREIAKYFVFCSVSEGSMSSMVSAGVVSWYDKCVCVCCFKGTAFMKALRNSY